MKTIRTIGVLALALLAAGCATKNYGRQGTLTDYESRTLSCREIELETARVHGFLAHVEKESQFDARSVLSFLGDFGMGNVMEKSSAIESANARLGQLQALRAQRRCGTGLAERAAPVDAPAPAGADRATAQAASLPSGEDAFNAERLAKASACHTQPRAVLGAKGTGFETYTVACANGDALMIRCERGNCRALQ